MSSIFYDYIYLHLNKLDSARYYLNKSLSFFQHFENPTVLYYLYTVDLGLAIKERDFGLAKRLLNEYHDSTGIVINIVSIRNSYVQNYYALTNNYKQAYLWQEENIRLNDSIRSGRVKKQAAELDMHYKQDTTLINQRVQINNQKNRMKTLQLTNIIIRCFLYCLYAWHLSSVLFSKTITDSGFRKQQFRFCRVVFNLFSQLSNKDPEILGLFHVTISPNLL